MNSTHLEAAAAGASAATAAASKLTYSSSAVAVVAGAASTTQAAHVISLAGLSLGEWCAVAGAVVAVGTFILNLWDKLHARHSRDDLMHWRKEEHDERMKHHGRDEGRPTDTGDL